MEWHLIFILPNPIQYGTQRAASLPSPAPRMRLSERVKDLLELNPTEVLLITGCHSAPRPAEERGTTAP